MSAAGVGEYEVGRLRIVEAIHFVRPGNHGNVPLEQIYKDRLSGGEHRLQHPIACRRVARLKNMKHIWQDLF
jgi:hypothetical protein